MCEEIEMYMEKCQMDKAYNAIRELDKTHKTNSLTILDEQGNILLNDRDIVERWKRYIEELYLGQG